MKTRSGSRKKSCYAMGVLDGKAWRTHQAGRVVSISAARRTAQEKWSRKARKRFGRNAAWSVLIRQGQRYAAGFRKGSGKAIGLIPVPFRGTAAAVLYAPRQAATLLRVLTQVRKLPLQQTVVVIHGATPDYFAEVRAEPGVLIVHLPDLPNPDEGRALGAKLTGADSVLFVDAERPVKAAKLARFLWAADTHLDAALNDVSAGLASFDQRTNRYRLAEFLNTTLTRRDLSANTMTVLPFALSRRALDSVGCEALACPAKAHAAAILNGLRVGIGGCVPADDHTKPTNRKTRRNKTAEDLAEAWRHALSTQGNRLQFPDNHRNREVIEEWLI